jgi:hypothetical protein
MQLFLLINEIIQMHSIGRDYIKNGWNYIELCHYLSYIAFCYYFLASMEYRSNKEIEKPLTLVIFQWFIILTGFMKVMFFLRISTSLGLLVRMVSTTIY